MVRIIYVEANGVEHAVEAEPQLSIMENAVRNGVPGILADCGGACACATCRIHVPEQWRALTGQASEQELSMLEVSDDTHPGVRLSCQVRVVEELEGLVVHLPENPF